MKKIRRVLGVCLVAALSLATVVMPAAAQSQDAIKVTLGYNVNVNGVVLPAGRYTIREVRTDNGSPLLSIRSDSGVSVSTFATMLEEPSQRPATQSSVVLRQTGNVYEIDRIWMEGRTSAYQLVSAEGRD